MVGSRKGFTDGFNRVHIGGRVRGLMMHCRVIWTIAVHKINEAVFGNIIRIKHNNAVDFESVMSYSLMKCRTIAGDCVRGGLLLFLPLAKEGGREIRCG